MSAPLLFEQPNLHAPPAKLLLAPGTAIFSGYQNFTLTPDSLVIDAADPNLLRRFDMLTTVFQPSLLAKRTVLDLGANSCFFGFWALERGAASVTAVDLDDAYVQLARRAATHLNITQLNVVHAKVDTWSQPADVVLALALIHWLYSCTASFVSLDALIAWLASLTRYTLLIEWIAPSDPAIEFFGHLDYNADAARGPYSYAAFQTALRKHFPRVEPLGFHSPTRQLFLAAKTAADLDLSGPLPILHDPATILSSQFLLCRGPVEYWSRTYDLGETILKQTSADLASREALFLNQLFGPCFPRAINASTSDGSSTLLIEKIHGQSLPDAAPAIAADPAAFARFVNGCLDILAALQHAGITHRDINADNIIVRDGLPVLLDFGWAVSADHPLFAPPRLGIPCRAPEGPVSDSFAVGKLITFIAAGRYPAIAPILRLMTHPDSASRLTDIAALRRQFAAHHQS